MAKFTNHPLIGKKVVVRQIRGTARRDKRTKATMDALGLGRVNKSSEFTLNAPLIGMLAAVKHLISVEETA